MQLIDFSYPGNIISLILTLLLFVGADFLIFRFLSRRIFFVITVGSLELVVLCCHLFIGFDYLAVSAGVALVLLISACLFANINDYRPLLSNSFAKKELFHLKKKVNPEVVFDRDELYKSVYKAVVNMSMIKRGCLITFMKKDDILDDTKLESIIKQRGVDLNAPVTPELLETIFYVGTPLHDGAVVIKDDKIARAAVFFTSTSKPLTGKYGSRHQAALGISENSDSVTIVVSEETGRIGIAFQGEITPVTPDNFLRVFEEDMAYVESSGEAE